MKHIYSCEKLSGKHKKRHPYKHIFNGNMKTQVNIFMTMKENVLKRQMLMENILCDSKMIIPSDPLRDLLLKQQRVNK